MATAESASVRLFGDTPSPGATAVGVSPWPGWKRLPDSLLELLEAIREAPEESPEVIAETRVAEMRGRFRTICFLAITYDENMALPG